MKQATFAYSFQGSSHIKKEENIENMGKKFPCQDRSFSGDFESSEITEKKEIPLFVKDTGNFVSRVLLPVELKPHKAAFSLVCVSDGHGGAPYFRSQKGAEFAVQTAIELLSESIDKIEPALQEKNYSKVNKNLSKSFVRRWIRKVMGDIAVSGNEGLMLQIKDLEKEDLKAAKTYEDEFKTAKTLAEKYEALASAPATETEENNELSSVFSEFSKLEIKSIYGCTVVVYFQVKGSPLWYAFKIGDSDLFASFDGVFVKPIADDPQCHENVTTSLCDDNAVKNFRFPDEQYLSKIPETVFCSSDGVANSFSNEDYLKKFYTKLQFSYDEDGTLHAENDIKETLPQLSLNGSGDDITLAGIITFDDSVEAKQSRRDNVKKLAENLVESGKYSEVSQLFKPYIDRGESPFKFLMAVYDYNETIKLSRDRLSKDFIIQWNKTFLSLNSVVNDISLISKSASLKNAIKQLHKLMDLLIENDIKNSGEIITQSYIDDLFNSFISTELNMYSYYKAVFEYKWLEKCFEKGYLTVFFDAFGKTEADLILLVRSNNFNCIEDARSEAGKKLSEMHKMMAKYWSVQR